MIRAVLVLTAFLSAAATQAETLRMAVTTSFANSGLADVLLPEIASDTGIEVQLLIVGTGQALRLGEAGDVDAVLVHSRAAEEAFVAAGHGPYRREIMYNEFVVVGPEGDPAGITGADAATEVFAAIARAQAAFVSRGDQSGTHKTERALWAAASVVPEGDWYKETGSGMGAALNTAAGLAAYILSDRATWLKFANKAGLTILFQGDPALFNQYAFLPVDAGRHPHVKADAVRMLENWLTSDRARELIDGYRIEGERLFTFNAVAE